MDREIERRNTAVVVELREDGDGIGNLEGYAAVFNRLSQNLGGFVEQVDPGAFTKSLADAVPVLARYNHDDNHLLGTTEAGTLQLEVDGTGLRYRVPLPDTSSGRDVRALAARKDLRYSSFAFRTIEDDWSLTPEGFPLRTLMQVQLVDVAPVNSPAYRDSTTALRSLAERVHRPLDEITHAAPDSLRDFLKQGDEHQEQTSRADEARDGDNGQGDTHPDLSTYRRRLSLAW